MHPAAGLLARRGVRASQGGVLERWQECDSDIGTLARDPSSEAAYNGEIWSDARESSSTQ